MAEGEAEKRKIAELYFGTGEAETNLKTISAKLDEIVKKTANLNLGNNLSIDTSKIKSNYKNLDEMIEKYGKRVTNTYLKGVNESQRAENAKAEAAYKSMLKQEEYNKRIEKSTKTLYDKIAEYAKTYVIYQAFNELKRAAAETVEEMVNVEYQMIAIDRVLNESSLDIDHYRDKLMQLAYDYGNSFNNVADITLRLAQAGFDSQEAIALTEKTLLALNTAELDATQATDDMVAVMAQWGLMTGTAAEQAKSYGDIIDRINKVADNFPTTSADIMDALKKVSSAFNLAGADIDETIATIVAAEKASQRGGKVIGTALSNITQQLKAEGKLNLAEELGLDFFEDDAKTKFKPVMEIFQEMANRMEQLKKEGKESSTEMQSLLELFTVFRRNIGASLLGEMAGGEESTYMQVYKTSIESVGYSLQENEKYMKSAKAAQEQFNTTLLQLKTAVWDNGLEDVFRTMLMLGNDVTKAIKFLIDTFGSIPTAIGVATMAMTAFNKQLKVQVSYKAGEGFGINNDFLNKIKQADKDVKALTSDVLQLGNAKVKANATLTQYIEKVGLANVSTKGYISYLIKQRAATIAAEAATLALNAALSLGLSAGITLIISGIDKLIHAEENAAKAAQERTNASKDLFESYEKERNSLDQLIKEYDELSKKSSRTPEEELKIYEIQAKINSLIKDQKNAIDLVNGSYDDTIKRLKEISKQERDRSLKQAEITKKQTEEQAESYGNFGLETFRGGFQNVGIDLSKLQNEILPGSVFQKSVDDILKSADYETTIRLLEEFKQKMEEADKTSTDMYSKIIEDLQTMYGLQTNVNEATDTYNEILAQTKIDEMFPEGTIKNIEDYEQALEKINSMNFSGMEGLQEKMTVLLAETFPEFAKKVEETNSGIEVSQQTISNLSKATQDSIQALADLDAGFTTVYGAMEEFNNQGYMSASTLKNLVDNDLLKYFDVLNGKLVINEAEMANNATAAKADAIMHLQVEAAAKIAALAFNEAATSAKNEGGAADVATEKTNKIKNALMQMTPEVLKSADAWHKLNYELSGAMDGLADDTKNEIQKIMTNLSRSITAINSVKIESVSYRRRAASGASSASRASETAAKNAAKEAENAAKEAEKQAQEIYKNSLAQFKDYMTEFERLEKRWVTNQKDLGLLGTDDYLYITEQRIKRYQEYLDEIRKATWLNDEDRLELEKKYTEGLEDLQVDYLQYVKDKLDEEVKALEDANDKKIDTIKEEAQARIDALKAVESETDRIREKEEYERRRQEHLDDISYWEQRTGREAQERLKEARANLEELDREWEEKQQDWNIEDQIKAIEDERDAQVKAIEDAQQAEIDAMRAVYDAKVKLFSESGQIIYENSVIQSQNLYNAYKKNFIDPVASDLSKLNQTLATNVTESSAKSNEGASENKVSEPEQQYETYKIKSGDTLTKIARQYGTTIEKILEANPYVTNKNKIYTGKTLQIPKFHEGGIVGGNTEGFALLKPNEVVLRPDWADGINKLAKMARQTENTITTNSTVIEVKGDLVKLEASIKNKTDAEYLTRRIEKVLKEKFNIKK